MKILLMGLVLINLLFAQQRYGLEDVYLDSQQKIWRESSSHRIANGYVSGSMRNGIGKSFEIVNGKLEGRMIYTFEDGSLFSTDDYKNGLKNGDNIWYSSKVPNQISRKQKFINGLQNGNEYSYYEESGNLQTISNYKDGKRIGAEKWFYENGNLYAIVNYKNGKKSSAETYYESGKISSKMNYMNSQTKGIVYYKNGNKKSEFEIFDKDNGMITTYQKNGQKEYDISIENSSDFIGYSYIDSDKKRLNEAQIMNYLKTREFRKAEDEKNYF